MYNFKKRRPIWPDEMSLSVELRPRGLLELLYVRSINNALLDLGVPPLDRSRTPDREQELEKINGSVWLAEYNRIVDAYAFPTGEKSYLVSVSALKTPDTEKFEQWLDAFVPSAPDDFKSVPEFRVGTPLVQAWRRGMRTIVVLPLEQSYIRSTGEVLVLSSTEYQDVDQFAMALSKFS